MKWKSGWERKGRMGENKKVREKEGGNESILFLQSTSRLWLRLFTGITRCKEVVGTKLILFLRSLQNLPRKGTAFGILKLNI